MDGDRLRLPANRNCYRLSRVSWALLKLLVLPLNEAVYLFVRRFVKIKEYLTVIIMRNCLLGGIAFVAQAILPITHIFPWRGLSVCLSVTIVHPAWTVRQGFHLAGSVHLWGPIIHCVKWGPWSPGKFREGAKRSVQNVQWKIAAKPSVLCSHLANTSKERFRFMPNYFGFCWYILCYYGVQDVKDCLAEEENCCESCCALSCEPSSDIVPESVSEDYFTAVFNLERKDMSVCKLCK